MPKVPYQREPYSSLSEALAGDIGRWRADALGRGRFAIVNPDIDGLLSYCILKGVDPSLRLGGYYLDESVMLLTEEAGTHLDGLDNKTLRTGDFLSVENDLLIMDSIGQHFCVLDDPSFAKINPNTLRYGRRKPIETLIQKYFGFKYPLSTAFFLWSVFNPDKTLTDEQLVALLYPDSAILKDFTETYRLNVTQWFHWLGHDATLPQFDRLARSADVRQIARCLFNRMGTAQPGLSFDLEDGGATINNAPVVEGALGYFCRLLGIPSQVIDVGVLRQGQKYFYTRVVVNRQPTTRARQRKFFDWLGKSLIVPVWVSDYSKGTKSDTRRVVSEALVTFGEWSVTTSRGWKPLTTKDVNVSHRVVDGRHEELPSHVASMRLRDPCGAAPYGCVWGACVARC